MAEEYDPFPDGIPPLPELQAICYDALAKKALGETFDEDKVTAAATVLACAELVARGLDPETAIAMFERDAVLHMSAHFHADDTFDFEMRWDFDDADPVELDVAPA